MNYILLYGNEPLFVVFAKMLKGGSSSVVVEDGMVVRRVPNKVFVEGG